MGATFRLHDYVVVLPMVQNVYAPKVEDRADAWTWGLKYSSGTFEYFTYRTLDAANETYEALLRALDDHWCGELITDEADADAGVDKVSPT